MIGTTTTATRKENVSQRRNNRRFTPRIARTVIVKTIAVIADRVTDKISPPNKRAPNKKDREYTHHKQRVMTQVAAKNSGPAIVEASRIFEYPVAINENGRV
jgi:hypothetical protein